MFHLPDKPYMWKIGPRENHPIRHRLRNREQEPTARMLVVPNAGRLETRRTPLPRKSQRQSVTISTLAGQGLAECPCVEVRDHISTFKVITTRMEKVIYQMKNKRVGNIEKNPSIILSMMAGAISSRHLFGHQKLQRSILRRHSRRIRPGKLAYPQLPHQWPHHLGRHLERLAQTEDRKITSHLEHLCLLRRLCDPDLGLRPEKKTSLKT